MHFYFPIFSAHFFFFFGKCFFFMSVLCMIMLVEALLACLLSCVSLFFSQNLFFFLFLYLLIVFHAMIQLWNSFNGPLFLFMCLLLCVCGCILWSVFMVVHINVEKWYWKKIVKSRHNYKGVFYTGRWSFEKDGSYFVKLCRERLRKSFQSNAI